ncbi:caspase domain-containing protein [Mycena alexandri]|uniref:Caspase domain-containing protein n=1 Tax=Mycena alexandri TaxID=1745969 RepID=A0AAD6SHG2_9AGAR|nr:caspase domain-containing protein [Mycena alexandri]
MSDRIFALIVAIDKYQSDEIHDLHQCLNDATLFSTYLLKRFSKPQLHIRSIYNEAATRRAILSEFRSHLIDNTDVNTGDALIFYFAGHGCRVKAPVGWSTRDGEIETICPYDELTLVDGSQYDMVPGIPDLTIASLLHELTRKKGENITVILDSCHSGGGTRRPKDGTLIRCRESRASDRKVPFPDIDRDIWTHEAAFMKPTGNKESGFRGNNPHALLAACRDDEFAADGYFTNQLVECLRHKVTAESTYADLATALSFKPDQHPQCEGGGDRIIFDTRIASQDHKTFTLTKQEDGKYSVKAWAIHGLRRGTRFRVIDSGALLFVEHIGKISSILLPQIASIAIPDVAVAVALLNDGNAILKVFLHQPLSIPSEQVKDSSFIIVTLPGDADLILTRVTDAEGKHRLHVESTDVLLRSNMCHVTHFAWSDVCNSLPRFLDRISHFRYHLGRHRDSDDLDTDLELSHQTMDAILDHVAIDMFRLGPVTSRGFREPEIPEKNLIYDRAANLLSDDAFKYGIRLKNTTAVNLFFYFFYFDPADYSIQSWYLPPHHQKAPGPAPETVTVGYGAGGGYPIQFRLEEGKNRDTGFLKVFVSTKYVDMRHMEQESAGEAPQRLTVVKGLETGIWGAWLGAVTVTAPGNFLPHVSALQIMFLSSDKRRPPLWRLL